MNHRLPVLLLAVLTVGACGDESPTDIGGTLLPPQSVRTFEVILEPGVFLVSDTAFSGYFRVQQAGFGILANAFEGALDARMLATFEIPEVISAPDSAGVARPDSTPQYFAGRVVVYVDSLRSPPEAATLQLFEATEGWDPGSATWNLRVDTTGQRAAWSQPGGAPGALVEATAWERASGDSIIIPIDSATIAVWRDTANAPPGFVIAAGTPGVRLRTSDLVLQLDARNRLQPDTIVTITVRPPQPTFIFNPSVASVSSAPRIGGLPTWRTFVRFREGLDTLSVPCPDGAAGCRVALRDAAVSYAALLLAPVESPPGFVPEDSVHFSSRLVVVEEFVPLQRSPLADLVGVMTRAVPASVFRNPAAAPIELPITEFIRVMSRDIAEVVTRPAPFLALIATEEPQTFGIATFQSMPRLKLVLTVATELQLR